MASTTQPSQDSNWTYPIRSCRLCRDDVVPTVTVSNPGLPAAFRSTKVTYISEDCGTLIKPCKCKGTQRYIHEACLAELRAKSPVKNAYLKCDLCGYQYNTKRLLIHDILLSRIARALLTILIVVLLMFLLGFVADPIINLYVAPVETLSTQRFWAPVTVESLSEEADDSWWIQHFMKGLVSIGVVGFLKAVLLANPFQYWNLRYSGLLGGGARTGNTGRDRAANISWIAIAIGVGSALYFFYQQVAKFSHKTLSKFANDVIEVQMDDDDDDLKPPPKTEESTTKPASPMESFDEPRATEEDNGYVHVELPYEGAEAQDERNCSQGPEDASKQSESTLTSSSARPLSQILGTALDGNADTTNYSSAIEEAQVPRWSFKSVEE